MHQPPYFPILVDIESQSQIPTAWLPSIGSPLGSFFVPRGIWGCSGRCEQQISYPTHNVSIFELLTRRPSTLSRRWTCVEILLKVLGWRMQQAVGLAWGLPLPPQLEASVSIMKDFEKSGKAKTRTVVIACFNRPNASSASTIQPNESFFDCWVSGQDMVPYPSTNLL